MSPDQKIAIVVEDEPDAAEMFAEMMRVSGYRVLKTHNSTTAMTMIGVEKPDIVILDVMMPDVSGLNVLQFIRRDPQLASIPVVVVSAKGMPSDIKVGMDAGASVYLTKPVGFKDLVEAVKKAMAAD